MGIFSKVFGSYSTRELARIEPLKKKVLELDEEFQALSDADLKEKPMSSGNVWRTANLWKAWKQRHWRRFVRRLIVSWAKSRSRYRSLVQSFCTRAVLPR